MHAPQQEVTEGRDGSTEGGSHQSSSEFGLQPERLAPAGPDDKLVQVIAFPAHGNLEGVMEVRNGAVTADQEVPPDHRTDLAQPDVELIDCGRRGNFAYAWRV